ncbi:hypothetical protein HDU93_008484 [Gonapodya sp. JEL0774]|nr:hypothetical protein HDU93_008484 [Gonapodya sp. JEL0774]
MGDTHWPQSTHLGNLKGSNFGSMTASPSVFEDDFSLVRRRYLQLAPVRHFSANLYRIFRHRAADVSSQRHFLSFVIDNGVSMAYPPPKQYAANVLKEVINSLEERAREGGDTDDDEIDEELMERFCDLSFRAEPVRLQKHGVPQAPIEGACFRSYELPPLSTLEDSSIRPTITLLEDLAFTRDGSTGLRTWTAALAFAEYLATRARLPHLHNHPVQDSKFSLLPHLSGLRVLELGAGCGLLSLTCSYWGAQNVVATDTGRVTSWLRGNVELNTKRSNQWMFDESGSPCVEVMEMDWSEPRHCRTCDHPQADPSDIDLPPLPTSQLSHVDLILATDVIFDPSLVTPFVSTISTLLRFNPGATALIASTVRNGDTYGTFRELIDGDVMGLAACTVDEFGEWWRDRKQRTLQGGWWYCEEGQAEIEVVAVRLKPVVAAGIVTAVGN